MNAVMLTTTSAARGKIGIGTGGKQSGTNQRKAEESHQQRCQRAPHGFILTGIARFATYYFYYFFKNVPFSNSSNACLSCSCVFITMGPYHATGSSSGLPETSKTDSVFACLHGNFVSAIEQNQGAVIGFGGRGTIGPSDSFCRYGQGAGCVAEFSVASEDVGEGVTAGLDGKNSCGGREEWRRRDRLARRLCHRRGLRFPKNFRTRCEPACRRHRSLPEFRSTLPPDSGAVSV